MRNRFEKQLDELNEQLIAMGSLCETCITQVAHCLARGKDTVAVDEIVERVYHADAEIDHQEREIEGLCLKLLLRQQPVARDLRLVSAALKMISDMERIGDQCADIADIVRFLDSQHSEHLESFVHIQDMALACQSMLSQAVESFVSKDLEIARRTVEADDQVDALFDKVKHEVSELIAKFPQYGEALLDLLMIGKYFERIGDHATNIAEWVEFSITGEHKEKTKYQFPL